MLKVKAAQRSAEIKEPDGLGAMLKEGDEFPIEQRSSGRSCPVHQSLTRERHGVPNVAALLRWRRGSHCNGPWLISNRVRPLATWKSYSETNEWREGSIASRWSA